jgi:phosphoribosylanthranilate isomerase
MIRVKICGITNIKDAIHAQESGADAIGFIFFEKSKRFVKEDDVKSIVKSLNPFICKVGVFVNESAERINKVAEYCGLTHVQLHGEENVELAKSINRPVIRALNFDDSILGNIRKWQEYDLLVDSGNIENRGGTGVPFDWQKFSKLNIQDFILAGGLHPGNIEDAIKTVKPSAVDVSSGVEKSPGVKDPVLVKELIDKVKKNL